MSKNDEFVLTTRNCVSKSQKNEKFCVENDEFCSSPPDTQEVWNLVHTILSGKIMSLNNRIVHADDVL